MLFSFSWSILTSTIYSCLHASSDKMMRRDFQLDKKAEKWYSTSNEFNVIAVWQTKWRKGYWDSVFSFLIVLTSYFCLFFFYLDIFLLFINITIVWMRNREPTDFLFFFRLRKNQNQNINTIIIKYKNEDYLSTSDDINDCLIS